eukprot:TRINITY_DN3906_c0_g1_i2.p1 TRINITY_DN3906_c0_g1~~TRINITY_DN3906_c0_g1_i2.p1  ORF type:complete len:131 (+),score=11.06 TRINITY_DN3906_c0_g1_i2:30-395(+)
MMFLAKPTTKTVLTVTQQRRWDSVMYRNLSNRIPARSERSGTIGRSLLRDSAQKWDPDWSFRHQSTNVRALQNDLEATEATKRILTYKLERMDYTVREMRSGTAPPPPPREVSTNITLDLL